MDGAVIRPRLARPVIYGLFEPGTTFPCGTEQLRYIGKAVNLGNRFKEHLRASKFKRDGKSRWISQIISGGRIPKLVPLHKCSLDEAWQDIERTIISHCRKVGAPLLNIAPGGEGGGRLKGQRLSCKHKEALRRAWVRRRAKGLIRKPGEFRHSEASKVKMRVAHLGRPKFSLRGRPLSAHHRKKLSVAHLGLPVWNSGMDMRASGYKNWGFSKGRVVSDDTRRKMSLVKIGKSLPRKGYIHSGSTRAKIAVSWARRKEKWPMTKGKISYGERNTS